MASLASSHGALASGIVPATVWPCFPLPSLPAPASLATGNPLTQPSPVPSDSWFSSARKHLAMPTALASGPLPYMRSTPPSHLPCSSSIRIISIGNFPTLKKIPSVGGGGKAPQPQYSVPGRVGVLILSVHHIPNIPHGQGRRGGQKRRMLLDFNILCLCLLQFLPTTTTPSPGPRSPPCASQALESWTPGLVAHPFLVSSESSPKAPFQTAQDQK